MAINRASNDCPGFTTDYFGRCALCKEPIVPDHRQCRCGALIFAVDPQPKQRQLIDLFLAMGSDIPTRIGYGGSRGAAKSRGLRDAALVIASEVSQNLGHGVVIYIVRTVLGDVIRNHVQEYEREHPPIAKWFSNGQTTKEYVFPDAMKGPHITIGYGDTFKDLRRFTRGPNIHTMLIDQAEGFTEEELDELHTPNRWPAAGPGGAKTGYFLNPGGPGSDFLNRVFFKKDFRETNLVPEDFLFLHGFGWDNWHGWFANEGVTLDGIPLTKETFYQLPGEIPPCPSGKYDDKWLASIPNNERFKIFVTQTSEGRKMWRKPDSIRLGELFGRFDVFAGQAFSGAWDEGKIVLR